VALSIKVNLMLESQYLGFLVVAFVYFIIVLGFFFFVDQKVFYKIVAQKIVELFEQYENEKHA